MTSTQYISLYRECSFRAQNGAWCSNPALDGHDFCTYHLGPPTLENVRDWVIAFISCETGSELAEVSEQSRLEADLDCASIDLVEVVMVLEEELGIEIPDEEAQRLQSVGDFISFVTEYLRKESSPTRQAAPVIDIESRKDRHTEKILNRIIQSELFRSYYEALELDEEVVVRLFRRAMGNRFIYHVTPVISYKDDEKHEPECVHLFLLGKKNLFYFRLLNRSVKFEWAALKDLRLTYEVTLDDNKKISMISVASSLAATLHDSERDDADSPRVSCDSEESLHNVAFDFVGKEIDGALEFLDKYLTNLEGENG